ncbi:MAG: hypothetical protein MK220_03550 [Candidatus Poseidoniia archaeon]|nr:hypothetical protein [Candidatus Poseidoniia archaeon]
MVDFKAFIKGKPVKLANCSQCEVEFWAPQELDTVVCSACAGGSSDSE